MERLAAGASGVTHRLAVAAAQLIINELRRRILSGERPDLSPEALGELLSSRVAGLSSASLRSVVNATGVILHTNLGRAPLAPEAAAAAALAGSSYTNLEYDLSTGKRGRRQVHVEAALCELAGAEAALAVNNNAAAVLLALAALAGGREVVVGRGQLIEIGGSFRMPEIFACSGADLLEVGTTNRTRIGDYEGAIGERTGALLRVHQSNFRISGFTEEVSLEALCVLGERRGLAVIDDLGSGAIDPIGDEPTLRESIDAGATLVCSSGDKLLGGPQAGLLVGRADAIESCRRHPLARAVRIDKMQLAALAETLRIHRFEGSGAVPALVSLAMSPEEVERRALSLAEIVGGPASVLFSTSRPGGGSLPEAELRSSVCAVDPGQAGADALAARLREGEPPVIVRVAEEKVLLDPRTIDKADLRLVGERVRDALVVRP